MPDLCSYHVLFSCCCFFFSNKQDDYNTDDTNNAQVSTYIAETVESEVADEGSGPYEDEGGIITLWA